MDSKFYHAKLGLPKDLVLPFCNRLAKLKYSHHALHQAKVDRYGNIELPPQVAFSLDRVVEVEVNRGKVQKAIFRVPYDAEFDLVMAVHQDRFEPSALYVRTVWLNEADDNHDSLDETKYDSYKYCETDFTDHNSSEKGNS